MTSEQAYLYILSTGWRNWWDLAVQHLCHVCRTQSTHPQQTVDTVEQTLRNPKIQPTQQWFRKRFSNILFLKYFFFLTCIALLPNFTTSNSIMFSMPFSWWWPFMRPAPLPPLPFSPAAFFPFFPPCRKHRRSQRAAFTTPTQRVC